mmetsp:Transcript_17650/g.36143  ORF Transcript_17650/g.36143 Transcript_17650/m.36143 type:complete len:251 (-) Transcript_17650:196-948(-)
MLPNVDRYRKRRVFPSRPSGDCAGRFVAAVAAVAATCNGMCVSIPSFVQHHRRRHHYYCRRHSLVASHPHQNYEDCDIDRQDAHFPIHSDSFSTRNPNTTPWRTSKPRSRRRAFHSGALLSPSAPSTTPSKRTTSTSDPPSPGRIFREDANDDDDLDDLATGRRGKPWQSSRSQRAVGRETRRSPRGTSLAIGRKQNNRSSLWNVSGDGDCREDRDGCDVDGGMTSFVFVSRGAEEVMNAKRRRLTGWAR